MSRVWITLERSEAESKQHSLKKAKSYDLIHKTMKTRSSHCGWCGGGRYLGRPPAARLPLRPQGCRGNGKKGGKGLSQHHPKDPKEGVRVLGKNTPPPIPIPPTAPPNWFPSSYPTLCGPPRPPWLLPRGSGTAGPGALTTPGAGTSSDGQVCEPF